MKTGKRIVSFAAALIFAAAAFTQTSLALVTDKNGFCYKFDSNGDAVVAEYKSSSTTAEIPSNIEEHIVKTVEEYAFAKNTDITKVVFPETLERIGECAFFWCINLETAVIPGSVKIIEKDAFAGCSKLTIIGDEGSAAWEYAQNNKIPFKADCGEKYYYGDVNIDGTVDSLDSLLILRASVELENFDEFHSKLADVDSDNFVTSVDALHVLRFSVKIPSDTFVGKQV